MSIDLLSYRLSHQSTEYVGGKRTEGEKNILSFLLISNTYKYLKKKHSFPMR